MDLRDYEQKKFAIAEILRAASRLIPDKGADRQERLRGLFARLAEDRFNLVVVGRFSRGKTSLMNAILNTDRLPTGIAPLTSVITTIAYGSKEQVVLKYDNTLLDETIPTEALPRYITQQRNPGNARRIKTAEIQLPAEILRRGFYFVDTPGLGSVIVENTRTTETFLPEADAFILVTSYESPLSEDEMRFFKFATASGRRIFVVVNKHDTVSPEDRGEALAFVYQQLRRTFGRAAPTISSVSSIEGLNAKRACDVARLAASGIPELERQLVHFLLTERSTEFLLRMCDRVRALLQESPPSNEIANLNLRLNTLTAPFGDERKSVQMESLEIPTVDSSELHSLGSCEVCGYVDERCWDFLRHYQYEISVNPDEQQRFADCGGFCPFHTWEYETIASTYGICNGYPRLLERLAARLRDINSTTVMRGALLGEIQRLLPSDASCVLCDVRAKAEQEAIAVVAKRLATENSDKSSARLAICLPHFVMLVATVEGDDVVRNLIDHQAAVLSRFAEDMRRYAIKYDAVLRHLASQEETIVAEQGLLSAAGRRRVNFGIGQTRVSCSNGPFAEQG
jgi:small GTP-binding protein